MCVSLSHLAYSGVGPKAEFFKPETWQGSRARHQDSPISRHAAPVSQRRWSFNPSLGVDDALEVVGNHNGVHLASRYAFGNLQVGHGIHVANGTGIGV